MRAHLPNTSRSGVVARSAVLLLVAAVTAGALGGCGGSGSPSAETLVNDTFASHKPAESGRVRLSFVLSTVSSRGARGASDVLAVRLRGPFQSLGPARLPRFALQIALSSRGRRSSGRPSAPRTLRAGVTSTAGALFVELAGTQFLAPPATVQALLQGYAQASGTASSSPGGSPLARLGLDARGWLVHPRVAGPARVAGAETTHIVAGVDVARFLADMRKLSAAVAPLALGAGTPGSGLLSPALAAALSSSVRSARANIYTGARDHLLRRLSLALAIAPTARTRPSLGGLRLATLRLLFGLTDLNQPQRILAPSNPQPFTKLLPALERLGLIAPRQPRR